MPAPKPINITDHATPEALRRAIDRVATLRARVIRVGLFGTLLYRPDPVAATDAARRARELDILQGEVKMISTVLTTLRKGAALPDTPQIIADWIGCIAAQMPRTLKTIEELDHLSRAVLVAAQAQSPDQRQRLADHMRTARVGFFEAVTMLCDALWDDLARQHQIALAKANDAAASLGDRLSRLEHIGRHVRLVSLNASVEAARAGDVGRGLMVIAHEFKSLAEEIQTLAKDARRDMAEIS